jgi:hypothetical protein
MGFLLLIANGRQLIVQWYNMSLAILMQESVLLDCVKVLFTHFIQYRDDRDSSAPTRHSDSAPGPS